MGNQFVSVIKEQIDYLRGQSQTREIALVITNLEQALLWYSYAQGNVADLTAFKKTA